MEVSDQVRRWFKGLGAEDAHRVAGAIDTLRRSGPTLGRGFVDSIKGSRHRNMKELRPGRSLRILFAFDPGRRAILLVGGDKRGKWNDWYRENIPRADRTYDEHLRRLGREVRWGRTAGRSSARSGR